MRSNPIIHELNLLKLFDEMVLSMKRLTITYVIITLNKLNLFWRRQTKRILIMSHGPHKLLPKGTTKIATSRDLLTIQMSWTSRIITLTILICISHIGLRIKPSWVEPMQGYSMLFASRPVSVPAAVKSLLTPATVNDPNSSKKPDSSMAAKWAQKTITLPPQRRGCHLVTPKVFINSPSLFFSAFMFVRMILALHHCFSLLFSQFVAI